MQHPVRTARVAHRRLRLRLGLPPVQPSDWIVGPPDFVGVGAQRAGTTWWYWLICDHPAVQPAYGKELHFFDRYRDRPFGQEEIRTYHRHLPRPPGSLTGEWTPRYMYDSGTPSLLHDAAPEAKILVLLRDPLERYRSGLVHERQVLKRALRGGRSEHLACMISNDALCRSLYGSQLARLFENYRRSEVLVLQYEQCAADPARQLRRTYEFLALDEADHAPTFLRRRTSPPRASAPLPDHLASSIAAMIADDAIQLRELVPELDFALWPSYRELVLAGDDAGRRRRRSAGSAPAE